jgi:NAD+ diphosphatase
MMKVGPCYLFQNDNLLMIHYDFTEIIEVLGTYLIRKIEVENQFLALELNPYFKSEIGEFLPLRQALSQFSEKELQEAIQSHFLIRWDKIHQYCGSCGQKTKHRPPAFERYCEICKLSFFPRISPSIIVRVTRGEDILMSRSPHFPPGVYGLIAGFIEAGETAEQAVHREVFEETGLKIKNLRYYGSQPWPFPDALMLAFTADYDEGELKVDYFELEDAGWYHKKNLPGRPSNPHSIATLLINEFISKN